MNEQLLKMSETDVLFSWEKTQKNLMAGWNALPTPRASEG